MFSLDEDFTSMKRFDVKTYRKYHPLDGRKEDAEQTEHVRVRQNRTASLPRRVRQEQHVQDEKTGGSHDAVDKAGLVSETEPRE